MTEESNAEILKRIKSQTLAVMDEVTRNPRPSYNIDGQQVGWTAYLQQLRETVKWCDEQLNSDDLYEGRSTAFT